VNRILDLI